MEPRNADDGYPPFITADADGFDICGHIDGAELRFDGRHVDLFANSRAAEAGRDVARMALAMLAKTLSTHKQER